MLFVSYLTVLILAHIIQKVNTFYAFFLQKLQHSYIPPLL